MDAGEYHSLERCETCCFFRTAMDEAGICCDPHVKIGVRLSDGRTTAQRGNF